MLGQPPTLDQMLLLLHSFLDSFPKMGQLWDGRDLFLLGITYIACLLIVRYNVPTVFRCALVFLGGGGLWRAQEKRHCFGALDVFQER